MHVTRYRERMRVKAFVLGLVPVVTLKHLTSWWLCCCSSRHVLNKKKLKATRRHQEAGLFLVRSMHVLVIIVHWWVSLHWATLSSTTNELALVFPLGFCCGLLPHDARLTSSPTQQKSPVLLLLARLELLLSIPKARTSVVSSSYVDINVLRWMHDGSQCMKCVYDTWVMGWLWMNQG